jgi:hypothetical protein
MKIMELEQKWLREQNELVRMVKDQQNKQRELKNQKDSLVVLTTKKMRIESKILLHFTILISKEKRILSNLILDK